MAVWGADVRALDALATRIAGVADQLEQSRRTTSATVHAAPWRGGDAESFRQEWVQHARAMDAAARALRQAATDLRRDAQQQTQASAADGAASPGWLGAPGLLGSLGGVVGGAAAAGGGMNALKDLLGAGRDVAGRAYDSVHSVVGGIGLVNVLTRTASTVGRYTDLWRQVNDASGPLDELMRYKQSPVLQHLAHVPGLRSLGSLADATPVSGLGTAFGLVDVGVGATSIGRGLAEGDAGAVAIGTSDTVAAALKTSRNPVAYLAGANVSIWTDVARNADDFHRGVTTWQPISPPWEGNAFSEVYVQSAKDVGSQLWGTIKKAFL